LAPQERLNPLPDELLHLGAGQGGVHHQPPLGVGGGQLQVSLANTLVEG